VQCDTIGGMLRKLQFAFSAVCGIICVLLMALWVRSYSSYDIVTLGLARGPGYMFGTQNGELCAARFRSREGSVSLGWSAWSNVADGKPAWASANLSEFVGVRYKFFPKGAFIVAVPLWFLVMMTAILAAVPWANRIKLRFSLLSLFFVTTLIAAVLGIFMARDWVNTEPQNTIPELPPNTFPGDEPKFTPVSVGSSWFAIAASFLAGAT
jgi:hypothetical protein